MAQHTLIPSLSALLPPASYDRFLSHVSLQSVHVEPCETTEHVYIAVSSADPGQPKSLRVRKQRRSASRSSTTKADDVAVDSNNASDGYDYSVAYLSNPLSGREYAEMNVRACIALDVVGCSTEDEVQAFVKTLGFRYTHSYTRAGLVFHLPLPHPASHMTLHLTVTRLALPTAAASVAPPVSTPDIAAQIAEPYLVQLEPCRPVPAVVSTIGSGESAGAKRDPGLEQMMQMVRAASTRIEGVKWETGRQ